MKRAFSLFFSLFFTLCVFSQDFWSTTGNTVASTSHFLGTTDNMPLIFKANNQRAGFTGYPNNNNVSFGYLSLTNALGTGTANTALGAQALQWNSAASGNVAIGTWALEWCTEGNNNTAVGVGAMCNSLKVGNHNVAIGQKTLFNNKQSGNTAVGSEAAFGNTTGSGITAIGFRALCNNTEGEFNTALGYQALAYNTTGFWNVALGSGSLQHNSTGRFNTAAGNSSLHFNRAGVENTAFGEQALGGNIEGSYNTAVGCRSLWSVLYTPGVGDSGYGYGDANTAVGYESLQRLTNGNWNVGVGVRALQQNSSGSDNVAIGNYALISNTTGNQNTAIGHYANVSSTNFTNATAIGYGATASSSNQVMIGNNNVTSIRAFAHLTTVSDRRIKKNIQSDVPGLDFINLLQPITYHVDCAALYGIQRADNHQGNYNDSSSVLSRSETETKAAKGERRITGFIAQDVETAAKSIGYEFSGIDIDESDHNTYGLSYAKFVVPLVKAVQELSEKNDHKGAVIASLQQQVEKLTDLVNRLINDNYTSYTPVSSALSASIEQNYPNPFISSTTIKYTIPQIFRSAKIVITDASGKVCKQKLISEPGPGRVTIKSDTMSAGIYLYSLYVDNTLVDTKRMVLM